MRLPQVMSSAARAAASAANLTQVPRSGCALAAQLACDLAEKRRSSTLLAKRRLPSIFTPARSHASAQLFLWGRVRPAPVDNSQLCGRRACVLLARAATGTVDRAAYARLGVCPKGVSPPTYRLHQHSLQGRFRQDLSVAALGPAQATSARRDGWHRQCRGGGGGRDEPGRSEEVPPAEALPVAHV